MAFGLDDGGSAGGAGGGAASGAAMGTMIMPGWGTAIGAGLGALGGIMGGKAAKREAKKRDALWKGMLGSVDLGASQARQDVAEQSGQAASGLRNSLAQRGLTGSTAFDAANNSILTGRGNAMAAINAKQAQDRNAILGQAPQGAPSMGAGLFEGLSGAVGKLSTMNQQGMMADRLTRARMNGSDVREQMQGGGSLWDSLRSSF